MPNEIPAGGWARQAPVTSEAGAAATATAVLDESAINVEQTPENRLFMDLTRVISLLVISGGLYFFYWLFLSWKHLARATDGQHNAVAHAFTLYVPFYGLFRLHRHMSVIKEVSRSAGLVPGFIPWVFIVLYLAAGVLESFVLLGIMRDRVSTSTLMFHLGAIAVVGGMVVWAQSTLNTYWLHTLRERVSETRVGVGEVIVTGVGALGWLTYLNI